MTASNIYKVALNSLSAHVAILDKDGTIIETNSAWREFAVANGMEENPSSIGVNYIEVCEKSSSKNNDESAVIAQGIRKVISGDIKELFIDYPCHSPQEKRWYALRVVPFREAKTRKVILAHENITPLIEAQQKLAKNEKLLKEQAEKLEENNIALKVLLKHREDDKKNLEDNIMANVRELILPYVDRLLEADMKPRDKTTIEIIHERLNEIISPFLNRLSSLNIMLTPQEIKVANFVREGKTSKEIADVLMISVSAVDFHRKQIRKKLGMTSSGKNLQSYLSSLR